MAHWIITNVPTVLLAVVVVVGFPALVVALQAAMRRSAPVLRGGEHNEVAGMLVAVIGALYAVLIGLTIVALWEQFTEARDVADAEAQKLYDIVRDSEALGAEVRSGIGDAALAYAEGVIGEEWDVQGRSESSPQVQDAIDQMLVALRAAPADGAADEAFLELTLDEVDALGEVRARRLGLAEQDIPTAMWISVLGASALTAGFCLLFGLRDARLHYALVGGVATMLAIGLFLMLVLDFPYTGAVAVQPTGLEELAESLRDG